MCRFAIVAFDTRPTLCHDKGAREGIDGPKTPSRIGGGVHVAGIERLPPASGVRKPTSNGRAFRAQYRATPSDSQGRHHNSQSTANGGRAFIDGNVDVCLDCDGRSHGQTQRFADTDCDGRRSGNIFAHTDTARFSDANANASGYLHGCTDSQRDCHTVAGTDVNTGPAPHHRTHADD